MTEKDLKRNMDRMLNTIYGSTGVDPEILASVSAVFDQFNKVGADIGTS